MTPEEVAEASRRVHAAIREAEQACDLHITVDGVLTPLRECDWVLRTPCGHAHSIMSAVDSVDVYTDAESAWHEMYDIQPHAHRRVRTQKITAMKGQGWTIVPMTRENAVKEHRRMNRECGSECWPTKP